MSVVKNLYKKLDSIEVSIPEWTLADEGITLLWGASGSGKTTVVRSLLGLETCLDMQWWFDSDNIALKPAYARQIGVVFQSLALFPHLTALENITFAIEARGLDIDAEAINDLLTFFELDEIKDRKAQYLSGGEGQKVALARALMNDPIFLILDEPFSALDIEFKKQARALLSKIATERRIPILLVSHDPEDARQLAQRVVTMEKGQIKTSQSPQEFLKLIE